MKAAIIDVASVSLSNEEKSFLSAAQPWALILFGRSCVSPTQVYALTNEIRSALGRDCLIFLDQEGGRVQRLKPPNWPQFPPNEIYGRLYNDDKEKALRAVYLHHFLIAYELRKVGINADCAPCLDLGIEGAHSVIGDRAFSNNPAIIGELGRAALNGLNDYGVAGVIKHIPGHGRALADSHHELPVIDAPIELLKQDISAFIELKHAEMAMTAHVKYPALDNENCATLSKTIIDEIIRKEIGFDGLLMTDDVSMRALRGTNPEKAKASIAAGCDVAMLCNAPLDERIAFTDACGDLKGRALERAIAAENIAKAVPKDFDVGALWHEFSRLTGIEDMSKIALAADPTERI